MSKLIVFEKTDGVVSFTSHPVYDMEENMFTSDPALQRCWMLVSDDGSRVLAEGGDLGIIKPQKTIFEPIEIQKWVEGLMPKRGGAEPVGASPDCALKFDERDYSNMDPLVAAYERAVAAWSPQSGCQRPVHPYHPHGGVGKHFFAPSAGAVRTGEDLKPAPADEPLDWEVRDGKGKLLGRFVSDSIGSSLWLKATGYTLKHVPQR